jgi:hypothetical protein
MSRPLVPISGLDPARWCYLLARSVNVLLYGGANVAGDFTITANAASTVVTDNRFESGQVPVLVPTTANAAAALASTYISARSNGSFTVTHANNAQVDRTFLYVFWG